MLARVTAFQTVTAFAFGPLAFAAARPVAVSSVPGRCSGSGGRVGGEHRGRPRSACGRRGPSGTTPDVGRGQTAAWRSRNTAALTRFWQAVEQNRRVPFREVST